MRKIKMLLIAYSLLLSLLPSVVDANMSSTSFTISTTVMSCGGNTMSSANFSLSSTLGEPSTLGYSSSNNYQLDQGFWYTLLIGLVIGDINADGVTNLEDVIIALQVATGQTTTSIFLEADVDGDGRIGLTEVIVILRKLGDLQF